MSRTTIRFELVKITPQMAREWLAIEPLFPPRTLRQRNVGKILHSIDESEWKVNHHAIALAPDGSVLDGRHRLTAIASQRKHVWCWVAFDCDPDTFDTMDNGASRSPGDTLKTAGYNDVNVLSAVTRQALAYEAVVGTTGTLGSITSKMTNTEIKRALDEPEVGKPILAAMRSGGIVAKGVGRYGVRTSATVLIAVIARHTSAGEDTQQEFHERLTDGAMLPATSPVHKFREWVTSANPKNSHQGIAGTYQQTAFLALGAQSWNNYIAGEELEKPLRYNPTRTEMPEIA